MPLTLAEALELRNVTHATLGRALGVSRQAVSAWVAEDKPIPEERVVTIENFLNLGRGDLILTKVPVRRVRLGEEPLTILDWLLRSDAFSKHLGEHHRDRVRWVADRCSVPEGVVMAWLAARTRVPMASVLRIFSLAWPGLNPFVLVHAREAGYPITEAEAVSAAWCSLPTSWEGVEACIVRVRDARAAWMEDPTAEEHEGLGALDIGDPIAPFFVILAGVVRERRVVQLDTHEIMVVRPGMSSGEGEQE